LGYIFRQKQKFSGEIIESSKTGIVYWRYMAAFQVFYSAQLRTECWAYKSV
jgi:hypothetical protein